MATVTVMDMAPRTIISLMAALTVPSMGAEAQTSSPAQEVQETQNAPNAPNAPQATLAPAWRFVPELALTGSYTDNAALAADPFARKSWVTDAAVGLHADYRGPRSTLFLDYRVHGIFYASQSALDNNQRFLNALANLDLVEKWLFLDARANISQQNRSPFGVAGIAGVPVSTANRVETTTYQVSPYIRGRAGDLANYQLRFNGTDSRTNEGVIPATRTAQWVGRVKDAAAAARMSWALDGDSLEVRNSAIGSKQDARLRASLIFAVDPLLHISLIGGRERTDFAGPARANHNIYGAALEWSPTDHTQVAAVSEKRFFGNDHLVTLSHRTPRTAWSFTSSRDVAVLPNQLAAANPGSVYGLMYDLLAASIPDPYARADAVRKRFEENGLAAGAVLSDGFLSARPYLNRRHELSVALLGIRNVITLTAARREQRGLGTRVLFPGGPPTDDVRQEGASASWAHKLTPYSSLTLTLSQLHSEGLFDAGLDTRQRLQSLFFVSQLGSRTSLSLGLRRVRFDSTVVNSYRENAMVCSLSVRF